MASCRSCQAEIDWAVTDPGRKAMPVDHGSADDPAGNLAVWRDGEGTLRCRVLRKGEDPAAGQLRGQSHWASCPQSAEHKRR